MSHFPEKLESEPVLSLRTGKKYVFHGPAWLVALMQEQFGTAIDYCVQEKIPLTTAPVKK